MLQSLTVQCSTVKQMAYLNPTSSGLSMECLLKVCIVTFVCIFSVLCKLGNYVHPPGGWIYYFCFFCRPMSGVRRPMSGVTHGFRSFKGKVLELLSPNLVCRLIGSVACLGLLLAVVPLLLTE